MEPDSVARRGDGHEDDSPAEPPVRLRRPAAARRAGRLCAECLDEADRDDEQD